MGQRVAPIVAAFAVALALAPPAFALWYIHTFGVNGAHWDHLLSAEIFERYYSGTITLESLTRPHLEHVKVFPRLVCLALGVPSRFNNLVEMDVQWLLLLATAGVLFAAFSRRVRPPFTARVLGFVPVTLVLFSVRHHEAMLTGDGMITYLSIAAAIGSSAVLAGGEPRAARMSGAIAAAIVASFSHAAGLLVWPIGALILAFDTPPAGREPPRRAVRVGLWLAFAAASVSVYAAQLPRAPVGAAQYLQVSASNVLTYLTAVAGVPLAASLDLECAFGIAVGLLEAAVVWMAIRHRRRGLRVPLGVWPLAFSVGCGLLFTLGRAYGNRGEGPASRYAAFMGLGPIGLYLASWELADAGIAAGRLVRRVALGIMMLGLPLAYREGLRSGPVEQDGRVRAASILATFSMQNDRTLETGLFPSAVQARRLARALEEHRLNVFARPLDPAPLPISPNRALFFLDAINGVFPATAPTIVVAGDESIAIAGWAFDRSASRPRPLRAAFVLVDRERSIPAAYGLHRPDVAAAFAHATLVRTGFEASFSASVLQPGRHEIALQFVAANPASQTITGAIAIVDKR